ncbi:MAG: nucleotide exchange factor GrpE, partial [Chthoniobacterales bacterium]|nr:nucleotide exchange factor GrpE [Chthoniobacterales bacterium]
KRTAREIKDIREVATEQLIRDLLPVLDNFERALQHVSDPEDAFVSGIRMVFAQLKDTLMARGLLPIEATGQPFDPNVHEALAQIESEHPEGTVVQEYEKGYLLGKRILRPAKVVVSKPPEQKALNNGENKE